MKEFVCSGVGTFLICIGVNGIVLDKKGLRLPDEYRDWAVEKAVYSPCEDKVYVQLSCCNIRRVVTL